jgi:hypothetical protein
MMRKNYLAASKMARQSEGTKPIQVLAVSILLDASLDG